MMIPSALYKIMPHDLVNLNRVFHKLDEIGINGFTT